MNINDKIRDLILKHKKALRIKIDERMLEKQSDVNDHYFLCPRNYTYGASYRQALAPSALAFER